MISSNFEQIHPLKGKKVGEEFPQIEDNSRTALLFLKKLHMQNFSYNFTTMSSFRKTRSVVLEEFCPQIFVSA